MFSFFRRVRYASGVTRGKQPAEFLDGRVDPKEGFENDVCIYLLGNYRREGPEVEHAYYDVQDCGLARLSKIRSRTTGGIIAISKSQWAELRRLCPRRSRFFVPHHHCNYARERRQDRPVLNVGCCGGDSAVQWPHDRIKSWLADMGLNWVFTNEYLKRERVVEFYRNLDVQIVFRPTHTRGISAHTNPVKLSNAGSFGIPTVCFPEPAYTPEWTNQCVYADNMGEMMRQVLRLKEDPVWYAEMSERARVRAEDYHIELVADFYRALPGV